MSYKLSFNNRTSAELIRALTAIPASVSSLDLSIFLSGKKAAEKIQLLSAIPTDVNSLYLGCGSLLQLWQRTGIELAQIFAAIPAPSKNLSII